MADVKLLATPAMLKGVYNISWRIAWTLDGIIRQTSYRYLTGLKDKDGNRKFSDSEAAQLAAKYHGDYAGVPARTRRLLNKVFFTPTFKIAMGKLYKSMIQDSLVAAKAMSKGDFKLTNTAEDVKINARALINTVAILGAWDILMRSLGFEPDEFGRRYIRQTDTDEGPKELVITWSGPHNLFLKYLNRAKTALGPDKQNPALHFFLSNKWEIHPLWRTLSAALQNEKETGERIYNVSDSMYVKTLKQMSYSVVQIAAIIRFAAQQVSGEELGLKQERELLGENIGKAFEMLSRPFTFTYTRTIKEQRVQRQAQSLITALKEEMTRAAIDGEPLPQENIDRMIERINAVLEQLKE